MPAAQLVNRRGAEGRALGDERRAPQWDVLARRPTASRAYRVLGHLCWLTQSLCRSEGWSTRSRRRPSEERPVEAAAELDPGAA